MRRTIAWLVLALAAAGCRDAGPPDPPAEPAAPLSIRESPSPFSVVEAEEVRALVPDDWRPAIADGPPTQRGIYASPRPRAWGRMDGSVAGLAALWVDAATVGIPSDFFYLAATGPALGRLLGSPGCRAEVQRVYADHRPPLVSGPAASPGDYVARGEGTCAARDGATRWAYFLAAPGFGPVRSLGIPSSGLYVVVAVVPDSRRAERLLDRLVGSARFGGTRVAEMIEAARARSA